MYKKRRIFLLFVVLLILTVSVSAAEPGFRDFVKNTSDVFKYAHELFRNKYIVWGSIIILLYMLVYGSLLGAARNVHIFEGEGGVGVNTPGKLVCGSLSGLFVLAMIYYEKTIGLDRVISSLVLFGFWGGLILTIVFFLILRGLLRSNEN